MSEHGLLQAKTPQYLEGPPHAVVKRFLPPFLLFSPPAPPFVIIGFISISAPFLFAAWRLHQIGEGPGDGERMVRLITGALDCREDQET